MTSPPTLSETAQTLQDTGQPFVLATLARVVGPAFRPLGARMIVEADGRRVGDLSGGCLDEDVGAQALEQLESGGSRLLVYDGERIADLARGFATGCPRRVEILLQRIDPGDRTPLSPLEDWKRERHAGVLLTWLPLERPRSAPPAFLTWKLADVPPAPPDDPTLCEELRALGAQLRADPRSRAARLDSSHGPLEALVEVVLPPPRLLCLGGSPPTLACLRQQASLLGWEAILVDGGGPAHAPPPADQRKIVPEELDTTLGLDARTCALVLTHHNARDREWIRALLASAVPYVGVMGSRRRLRVLFESMGKDGLTPADHGRIHGPVGLDLGGREGAQMALSIFAEMQSVLEGRPATPMRHHLESGDTAALVLAAGGSKRLGTPKQLLRHGRRTLLHRAVRQALEAGCRPVVVVLGSQAQSMRPELEGLDVSVCVHEGWREGLGSSLARGVRQLRSLAPRTERLLVLLCDQPAVDTALLEDLLEHHGREGRSRTACEYAGTLGPPTVFEAEHLDALEQLGGDQGARDLLRHDDTDVARLPFAAGALDIDRTDDLQADQISE